ncbi:MAG: squalene--hopene cyclase [Planctomycetota bacterium]
MNPLGEMWADSRLVYTVASAAVASLVATIWLFRRRKKSGRQAAVICLLLSVGLHAAIFFLVPLLPSLGGASRVDPESEQHPGASEVAIAMFVPEMNVEAQAGADEKAMVKPLPVADFTDLLSEPFFQDSAPAPLRDSPKDDSARAEPSQLPESNSPETETEIAELPERDSAESKSAAIDSTSLPSSMLDPIDDANEFDSDNLEGLMDDWLNDQDLAIHSQSDTVESPGSESPSATQAADEMPPTVSPSHVAATHASPSPRPTTASPSGPTPQAPSLPAATTGERRDDFANRAGAAKQLALQQTGGDASTEAAVAKALQYLARQQRPDGGFDSRLAGAGTERRPLGESRADRFGAVAGSRSDAASTGLSLLAMIGAGSTHRQGDYSENVYRGLVYLIGSQKRDGSLAGDATLYASNYCHGMAGLAIGEAAVLSRDPSAIEATRRAMLFTKSMQHSRTGGFRYTRGDPGDLSQLGWQAMIIDAAGQAGLPVGSETRNGIKRFLRSVRAGRSGGLASYRPGERPTRTMTAEALATRLLLGEDVPASEVYEAEQFLLEQPPGVGQDNYYYWYYATIALHQLQDAAWQRWNEAMKSRLLATQNPDGSWPTSSVWGGYGGSVYTTAMATLCLESYYRHQSPAQSAVIATRPN